MRNLIILSFLLGFSVDGFSQLLDPIEVAKSRCAAEQEEDKKLYQEDFAPKNAVWYFEHSEMADLYQEIYNSGKRLTNRAFFGGDGFFIPYQQNLIQISEESLRAIIIHAEEALRLKYAEFIFFPDMGHAHLLTPLEYWEAVKTYPSKDILASIINHPGTKALYHTAEKLKMHQDGGRSPLLEDPLLQWRYWTRNLVADLGPKPIIEIHRITDDYNTVHDVEGYWKAWGFDISASKDGCFPFQVEGETMYFDLNFDGLQSSASSSIFP